MYSVLDRTAHRIFVIFLSFFSKPGGRRNDQEETKLNGEQGNNRGMLLHVEQ